MLPFNTVPLPLFQRKMDGKSSSIEKNYGKAVVLYKEITGNGEILLDKHEVLIYNDIIEPINTAKIT